MENNPHFSVIIPTYNREQSLQGAIESVLDQIEGDFELLVIDDGSIDNTEQLVRSFKDERIYYHFQENAERAAARNHGIRLARGEYVTFLDSDDRYYPNYLSHARDYLARHRPLFFHSGYEIKTSEGRVITQINDRSGDLNGHLLQGNSLSCMGVFVQSELLKNNLFIEERDLSGSEDYELWLRLAAQVKLHYSNEITAALIQHEGRSVINVSCKKLISRIRLLVTLVLNNEIFIRRFGKKSSIFVAHSWLYLSLHLVMSRCLISGLRYWIKALTRRPVVLFSRKTLGIFKNMILLRK